MWTIRRLDALPAETAPNTIYFIDNGDGTATQYVTGRDGVARLAGGGIASAGPGFRIVGAELRYDIASLTRA